MTEVRTKNVCAWLVVVVMSFGFFKIESDF